MVKKKRKRPYAGSDKKNKDQTKGDRSLYQGLYGSPKSLKHSDCLTFLAEKSGESISQWKARVENKVLHLKRPLVDQTSLLLESGDYDYQVNRPCSKFSGISNSTAKKMGFFDLKSVSYDQALEFNTLWFDYAKSLLGTPKNHLNASKLVSMLDLQGSLLEVVYSNCSSYVGLVGIVLRETQNGFNIVDKTSKVRFILKNCTVFKLDFNQWSFFIHGRHISASPAHRTKSKLKPKTIL